MTDQQERSGVEAEFARSDASTDPFVSAVRATRMPMLITDPSQPDNPIVFVNAAFSSLTGYDRDEIIGRNCVGAACSGPSTRAGLCAIILARARPRDLVPVRLRLSGTTGRRMPAASWPP